MPHKQFDAVVSDISRVAPGEKPYPLREKRSRYTHMNGSGEARTIIIHKPKFIITTNADDQVEVINDKSIFIRDGIIEDVFDPKKCPVDLNEVDLIYDASKRSGLAVTPGFVNAHAHPPMYLLRSSLLLEKGETLEKTLKDMFELESQMNNEDFFISAIGDLTEEQKNGITTTLSHYAVFDPIDSAAELVRHNVINAISAVSNSHPENTPAYVAKLLKNRKKYYSEVAVAIHTLQKAKPATLKRVAELVKKHKALFTTHIAETTKSVEQHIDVHGEVPVKTLKKYGLANKRTIMSHCVHLTEDEIKLVAKHNMGVVHLPTSNKIHKSGEFQHPL